MKKGDKTMKKVLLSSVAALALFAAAAPAFANENPINGGANTPGAFDSREAYENQTEFEMVVKLKNSLTVTCQTSWLKQLKILL